MHAVRIGQSIWEKRYADHETKWLENMLAFS